jgi:hypothetical protein
VPKISVWAVRAALVWLGVGALLGGMILARGALGFYGIAGHIPAHGEMMLVGWMMQLAFGVAHWILPRTGPKGRGAEWPVGVAIAMLNVGVLAVTFGAVLLGRLLALGGAIAFAVQGAPRIRAAGWGATGKGGDLVRLTRPHSPTPSP